VGGLPKGRTSSEQELKALVARHDAHDQIAVIDRHLGQVTDRPR
jgi:hypothetical protein